MTLKTCSFLRLKRLLLQEPYIYTLQTLYIYICVYKVSGNIDRIPIAGSELASSLVNTASARERFRTSSSVLASFRRVRAGL